MKARETEKRTCSRMLPLAESTAVPKQILAELLGWMQTLKTNLGVYPIL